MEWYQWVSYVVGILGIGSVIGYFIKEFFIKKTNRYAKGTKEERKEEILEVVEPLFENIEKQNNEIKDNIKNLHNDVELLKQGEQASLRHNLLEIYNTWQPRGYCPQDVKDDFENQYQKYHKLGANGVMNAYRDIIISLPVNKAETKVVLNESR